MLELYLVAKGFLILLFGILTIIWLAVVFGSDPPTIRKGLVRKRDVITFDIFIWTPFVILVIAGCYLLGVVLS